MGVSAFGAVTLGDLGHVPDLVRADRSCASTSVAGWRSPLVAGILDLDPERGARLADIIVDIVAHSVSLGALVVS